MRFNKLCFCLIELQGFNHVLASPAWQAQHGSQGVTCFSKNIFSKFTEACDAQHDVWLSCMNFTWIPFLFESHFKRLVHKNTTCDGAENIENMLWANQQVETATSCAASRESAYRENLLLKNPCFKLKQELQPARISLTIMENLIEQGDGEKQQKQQLSVVVKFWCYFVVTTASSNIAFNLIAITIANISCDINNNNTNISTTANVK